MTPGVLIAAGVAGVLGILVGSFLNVVVYRVPAGISLLRESRCPHCDAPVVPQHNVPIVSWIALGGRCARCRAPISARYPAVEVVTGVAFAVVTWWGLAVYGPTTGSISDIAVWLVVVAYLFFASASIVLTLIDLDTHRLPDSVVLPGYAVAGILFSVVAALTADGTALLRAGIGAGAMFAFYFALRLARPGGMGGGDVKLAGVVGAYLGWIGWGSLVVGAFGAFVLGGVFGIVLLLTRRAGRKTAIPFGPWMILGAWTGVFAGESIGRWYASLLTGA